MKKKRQKNRVIIIAFIIITLLLSISSWAAATMYACRTAGGKKHYTNVRLNSNCKEVAFSKPVHRVYKPEPLVIDVSKKRTDPQKDTETPLPAVAKRKVYKYSNWMERFSGSKGSSRYDSYIKSTANKYGVDPLLIKAIIHIESGFNHRAVSNKGAQGLMQLMPQTARDLRVWNPFDPMQNIDGGTRYIRKMLKTFHGDLRLSLAAYNAGPNLVGRVGRVPAIPETRNYVRKVISQYNYYKKNKKEDKKDKKSDKKRKPGEGIKIVIEKNNKKIAGKN